MEVMIIKKKQNNKPKNKPKELLLTISRGYHDYYHEVTINYFDVVFEINLKYHK